MRLAASWGDPAAADRGRFASWPGSPKDAAAIVTGIRTALEWVDTEVDTVVADITRSNELDPESAAALRPLVREVVTAVLRGAEDGTVAASRDHDELVAACRAPSIDRHLALQALHVAAEHTWRRMTAEGDGLRSDLDSLTVHEHLVAVLHRIVEVAYAHDRSRPAARGSDHGHFPALRFPTGLRAVVAVPAAAACVRAGGPAGTPASTSSDRSPVRAVQLLRSRVGRNGTVLDLGEDFVIVLSPVEQDPVSAVTSLLHDLELAAPTGLAFSSAGERLSGAIMEACEILGTVRALGYPPALYRMEDVALEILLRRSPDVARKMRSLLEPLTTSGHELLDTLSEVLEGGRDRRATARTLSIHPNTLAYRLRRINELTRLSAGGAVPDQWVLRIALTSMRLTDALDGAAPGTTP